MKSTIYLFVLSIIFIFYAYIGLSHAYADPHPNCTGYSLAGEQCGGDTTKQCCPDGALVCIPARSPDRPGTCNSCTGLHGDACDTSATSGDKCCGPGLTCSNPTVSGATQCLTTGELNPPPGTVSNPCPGGVCTTAFGQIKTNAADFVGALFRIILSLSGGAALIMIVIGGYRLAISQGNPEKVQQAREVITSAIIGLLFVIFSVTVLQIIGVDVLGLPGFNK